MERSTYSDGRDSFNYPSNSDLYVEILERRVASLETRFNKLVGIVEILNKRTEDTVAVIQKIGKCLDKHNNILKEIAGIK